jgi:hypothetical protein
MQGEDERGLKVLEKRDGTVSNNKDPEQRGRLKISLGDLLPDMDLPEWIEPSFPYAGTDFGWFALPSVGSKVVVEIVGSDPSLTEENRIRWTACLYTNKDSIPDEFKTNYPERIGLKTPNGIVWILDDSSDTVFIGSEVSSEVQSVVTFDKLRAWLKSGGGFAVDTTSGQLLPSSLLTLTENAIATKHVKVKTDPKVI